MVFKKSKYVRLVEASFIQSVLKPWHKRNHKLLHIGHHSNLEPSYFWDLGFDVTYLATTQENLDRVKEKNGKKIEYYLAQSDHLPFDDKVFDFVYIAHTFARKQYSGEQKKRILQELMRVSAQGICIVEYNTFACTRLKPNLPAVELRKLVEREFSSEALSCYTTLPLPACLWKEKFYLKSINSKPCKIPFGSIMAIRIALNPVVMTPLTLQVQQAASDISA